MALARIAFLAANPKDKGISLRQTEELGRLKDALAASRLARRVEVVEALTAQAADLERLAQLPDLEVLHFSGFEMSEDKGGILLEDAEGYSFPVPTTRLVRVLDRKDRPLRLVVLNCCHSLGTARALTRVASSVVGFEGTVTDVLCNAFADALYQRLFERRAIRPAFDEAVDAAAEVPEVREVSAQYGLDPRPGRLVLAPKVDAGAHLAFTACPTSVFISYGGSDVKVAERLHDALEARGIEAFCFSRDAQAGQPLHQLMYEGVNRHDKTLLLCSKESLQRTGVLNEIEEVLRRGARNGGRGVLIPIALDDHVFGKSGPEQRELFERLRDLVIADFRAALRSKPKFDQAVERLVGSFDGD